MNRTIIIGDLHGCYDEAVELLKVIGAQPSDRVVFAGDLVDRGPKPKECVELAMQHECVLGNHEEKHLRQRHSSPDKIAPSHLQTRENLSDKHYDYFHSLPTFLRLPEFKAVVVHAGCYPSIPVEDQYYGDLLHIQSIKPPDKKSYWPSKAPAGYRFWTNYWKGPERVIFGHSVLTAPMVTEFAVGIDTGAVFGFPLTAVVLPEWKIVSVPSKAYFSGKKHRAAFPIHGDIKVFS